MRMQLLEESTLSAVWNILLIDWDEDDFILIRDMLKEAKGRRINLSWASTYEIGQTKLAEGHYDALLIDNDLGARTGIELIHALNLQGATAPLILFTGRGSYAEDLEAMQAGATLYMSKNDLNPLSLERFIRYAIERKRDEISLKESEEKFARAFRASPAAQLITRLYDGIIIDINESYEHLFGYSRDELIGHRTTELDIYPNLQERDRILALLKQEGRVSNFEMALRSKTGNQISILGSIETIYIGGEEYYLSTLIDITERKRVEAALEASERQSRELIQYAPTAIYEIDFRTQRFTAVNDAMVVMSGYSREELLQMSAYDLAEEQSWGLLKERMRQWQLSQPPTKTVEYRIKTKDGRLVDAAIDITVTWDEHGRPLKGTVIAHDITERKTAELALRESEERFRVLFHNRHSPMLLLDPETGQIVDANPAASAFYGWSQEEMTRMKITEINTLPADQIHQVIDQLEANATGRQFTFRHRLASGELRDVEVSSGPIQIRQKKYLFSIIHDITERRQFQEALRKSEEKFAKAFRASPIALAISSVDEGRFIEINDSYAKLYGYSREEIIGHTSLELNILLPEDRQKIIEKFRHGRGFHNVELRGRAKSGEIRDTLFSTEPIEIDGKEYMLSVISDITDRKRVEAELRKYTEALLESEQKYRSLFENSTEAVFLTMPDGSVQAANPAACAMFGWSEEEIIRLGRAGLLDTEDPRLEEALEIRKQAGRFQAHEYTGIRKGGERFPVEVDFVVLPGEPKRSFVILRDITERKQAEALLQANEERERTKAHELEAILDAVPAYIFITHDPDSRTMTTNRATHELLRSKPGDNISKSAPEPEIPRQFRVMRDGQEIPTEELPVQRAAKKCLYVKDYEFDLVFDDGECRRLIGNAAPLCDADGNPAGAVGAFIDITELRRIEQETSERIAQMEVQRRLLEHREMERSQIARDLHDGPIQSLGGLSFSLQLLHSAVAAWNAPQAEEAREVIEQIKQDVRDLVGELRGVCNELRPPLLERFGFRKAVWAHAEGFREKHPEIKLDLDITENSDILPENIATALFRIYQEALNNIIRHSGATEITVQFAFDPQQIHLEIQDNGKGLPAKVDWVELARQGHFGLVGMKERAEAIGGELTAGPLPEKGTTIRVIAPFTA